MSTASLESSTVMSTVTAAATESVTTVASDERQTKRSWPSSTVVQQFISTVEAPSTFKFNITFELCIDVIQCVNFCFLPVPTHSEIDLWIWVTKCGNHRNEFCVTP